MALIRQVPCLNSRLVNLFIFPLFSQSRSTLRNRKFVSLVLSQLGMAAEVVSVFVSVCCINGGSSEVQCRIKLVKYAFYDCLRAGRSGYRIPVGARFSAPVQTGPEAHPASCTMGTGPFPGVSCGRGVTLTPHPLLVPRSKIEWSYTSTFPKGLRGL